MTISWISEQTAIKAGNYGTVSLNELEAGIKLHRLTSFKYPVMSNNKRPLDLLTRKNKRSKIFKLAVGEKQISSRVSTKCNGILCLFIRFVQGKNYGLFGCSGRYCITLLNFLSTKSIDVNEEGWKSKLEVPCQLSDEKLIKLPSFWAESLCNILPILLKCNGNIRFVDDNGKTILHVFLESFISEYHLLPSQDSAHKIIKTVQYLMDSGISMQAADENGNTPVHLAAKLGNADLIEMMLQGDVSINACNQQGDTILHLVAGNSVAVKDVPIMKSAELAKFLLKKGADVNLQNKAGWTPVHEAAKLNHLYMLKVFARKKPNLKLLTNNGENALLLSCKSMHLTKEPGIDLLLNGGSDVNVRCDANGYSPLHYASMYGCAKTMKSLIGAGADLRCITSDYFFTPLHSAVYHAGPLRSNVESVETLLEAGAEIDARALDGVTPLHLAVLSRPHLAEHLIQRGADVHCREAIFGFTLIHLAVLGCLPGSMSVALKQEVLNVNDGGYYGITALHLASFLGDVDSVRTLIQRGADVRCRDVRRSTPLHFASKAGGIWDLIGLESRTKCRPFWSCRRPCKEDKASVMALLVENGADVNFVDELGRTPLHLATVRDEDEAKTRVKEDLVGGLLKFGAHVDLEDDGGSLPLHNALATGHVRALKSLLEFGVDVDDDDTIRIVYSSKKNLRKQVLKYNVKLIAAQLPVSKSYIAHTDNWIFKDYYFECLEEVENMKSYLVDDINSLYDLLHMNWRKQINLVQNVPADLQEKFPLYWGIIRGTCRDALQRKSLIEPAKSAWYQITEVYLPDICVERILDHLKNRYLGVLIDEI